MYLGLQQYLMEEGDFVFIKSQNVGWISVQNRSVDIQKDNLHYLHNFYLENTVNQHFCNNLYICSKFTLIKVYNFEKSRNYYKFFYSEFALT